MNISEIFSITNDDYHKIFCVLGIKFKIKDKVKFQINELQKDFNTKLKRLDELNIKRIKKTIPFNSIETIEIHIVEHCNLQCKGCVHFSPLANEEFLDIKTFEKDLRRLHEITNGNIKIFNILGGEPLLHPNCIDFLLLTREIFPDSIVKLVTNGILLPEQDDNFFIACHDNGITIEPTKYDLGVDWNLVEEKCKIFKVNLAYFQGSDLTKKTLYKDVLDLNGKHNPKESFLNCRLDDKSWFFLDHGKLYKCARNAYIRHFNNYFNKNLEVTQDDYVDIYKIKNIDEILQFCAKPSPFCKYCANEKNKYSYPWSKSEKKITEWTEEV